MTQPQLLIQQMSFHLPSGKALFHELSIAFSQQKTGLVGRNGVGKSTLLKLILGELRPHAGTLQLAGKLAYVPQTMVTAANSTVAQVLGYEEKIQALQRITQGSLDENDLGILQDDWHIEERVQQQLAVFGLEKISHQRCINSLSGGEITRLLLAKAFLSDSDFLLLDEPTNHLDYSARQQLYHAITQWQKGMIVISHDRTLLNLMDEIVELSSLGAASYGGNYDAYEQQKTIEQSARAQELSDAKKLLQKTKHSIQNSHEKHEQKQSYGRELRRSGSIDKMGANSKKGRSEKTQSKLLIREERMLQQAQSTLQAAKDKIEIAEVIHVDLPLTYVPSGKIMVEISDLAFSFAPENKIIEDFNLILQGPQRIAIMGENGSGKTTLIKLIMQKLIPQAGEIYLGTNRISYLDQHASLLDPNLSILENFLQLNAEATENFAYQCLAQFLFKNTAAQKLVKELSGGEKLRALLACVLMSTQPPQLLVLDEPTNHLDLQSMISIESALKHYQGAMIVISHDQFFLENIGVRNYLSAPFIK